MEENGCLLVVLICQWTPLHIHVTRLFTVLCVWYRNEMNVPPQNAFSSCRHDLVNIAFFNTGQWRSFMYVIIPWRGNDIGCVCQ